VTSPDSSRSWTIQNSFLRLVGARGSLRARLIKSTGGTFALQITATGLGFLTTLLLARVLGAAEYGAYAYAMAWIGLLVILATLGFHQLLVRDVAIYRAQEEWGLLRGLLRFSNRLVLTVSIVLMVMAALAGWILLGSKENNSMLLAFWVALLILPFSALTQLRQSAMRGFYKIVQGQLPEMIIRPVLFLLMLGGAVFLFRQHLSAQLAVVLNVVAIVVAFSIGTFWFNKTYTEKAKRVESQFRKKAWLRSAMSFAIISVFQLASTKIDLIMLGAMDSASMVGIYNVASQVAWLISIILMAVNTVLAPQISTLWSTGDKKVLEEIIVRAARLTFAVSLCIWVVLVVWGEWCLSLFGAEYTSGYMVLVVLASSLTLCTVAASVGLLLTMTSHERYAAWLTGASALINIILNAILIPKYSLNGAAIATGVSVLLMNIGAILMVVRLAKLNPTIFNARVYD